MGKIVRFYQTEDGKTPVKDLLDSLTEIPLILIPK